MRIIKPIIGCVLIAAALAGLFYWEHGGRVRWTMEEVIVAAEDIREGDEVTGSMLRTARVPSENIIDGALRAGDRTLITGKISTRPIKAKSQIAAEFFDDAADLIGDGKSIFVLKPSWIDTRSSSLRAGDTVHIYSENGDVYLGTFKVAFVKDDNEQEVVAADGISVQHNILDRKMSTRAANHVEIIAGLDEYKAIGAFVADGARTLMLVQKGEF